MTTTADKVVLNEEPSDARFGFHPEKRPLSEHLSYGLILLDKPPGPTSHEAVAWVRRIAGLEKAGHSGTLDPLVTGVLPVGLGEATKALSILLLGPKEYIAVARLHSSLPETVVEKVVEEFGGEIGSEIYQRPPQRSSVKRVTRTRWIYKLEIVERTGNLLLLRVLCQAGTYIRKLIYDIGEVLGCGGTMVELRRVMVTPFTEEDSLTTLHELYDAFQTYRESGDESKLRRLVIPVERAFGHMKAVVVRDSAVDSVCHGAQLAIPGIVSLSRAINRDDLVGLFTGKGEIVAISQAKMSSRDIESSEKGIAFVTRRVIMKSGTYPRMWKKGNAV